MTTAWSIIIIWFEASNSYYPFIIIFHLRMKSSVIPLLIWFKWIGQFFKEWHFCLGKYHEKQLKWFHFDYKVRVINLTHIHSVNLRGKPNESNETKLHWMRKETNRCINVKKGLMFMYRAKWMENVSKNFNRYYVTTAHRATRYQLLILNKKTTHLLIMATR